MALSQEDLKAIRDITEEVVDRKQDELAIMIKTSFDRVEQRFGGIEERLDKEAQQIGDIKITLGDQGQLLHRMDRRTHEQQQTLTEHEIRLRRIEKHEGLRPLPGATR